MAQTMTATVIDGFPSEFEKISIVQELHDITSLQETTLDAFKSILIQRNLYTPATVNTRASHDDTTLLRYLKARKWDQRAAADMFAKSELWRKQKNVDEVYENFDVEEFEMAKNFFPQWTGRRDRQGNPLYNFVISSLDSKSMNEFYKSSTRTKSSSTIDQRIFTVAEHVTSFITPLCSSLNESSTGTGRRIATQTSIVDITGVSLSQFWNLRKHLQEASDLTMNHYPECIENVFLIGAPSFFPKVLSYAKGWFEPTTTRKIHILSPSQVTPTLLQYVDADDLPKRYGGNLEWDFKQDPIVDERLLEVLKTAGVDSFPRGTARWEENQCMVLGTEKGVRR